MTESAPRQPPADLSWHAVERWQQYDGEFRANVMRILAVGSFYAVHLLHYHQPFGMFELGAKPPKWFHQGITVLAATWMFAAVAVDQSLRHRIFPRWLPYVTTALDLALLTAILCLGGGQQSPLVPGFLLILILVSLRCDLVLIRYATLLAMFCYLFLMAAGRWPSILGQRQIADVPRYAQIMTLLAIGLSGIMLGQLIRRFRTMATWYAKRTSAGVEHE